MQRVFFGNYEYFFSGFQDDQADSSGARTRAETEVDIQGDVAHEFMPGFPSVLAIQRKIKRIDSEQIVESCVSISRLGKQRSAVTSFHAELKTVVIRACEVWYPFCHDRQ